LNPSGIQKKRSSELVPFFEYFENVLDMAFSDNFGAAIADDDVYFWGVAGEVERPDNANGNGNRNNISSDSSSSENNSAENNDQTQYKRKKTLLLKGIAPQKLRFPNRKQDEKLTKVFCSESSVWALTDKGRVVVWEEIAQRAEKCENGNSFDHTPPKIMHSVEVTEAAYKNSKLPSKIRKRAEVCDLAVGKSHCGAVMVDNVKFHSEEFEADLAETANRKPAAFFLGMNDRGQCGIPEKFFVQKFEEVKTLEDFDMETPAWKSVAVGGRHSFLLSKTGAVFSFGCDSRCQLGVGDSRSVFRGSQAEHDAYTFQKFQQGQAVNNYLSSQYNMYPFTPENQNFKNVSSNFNANSYFDYENITDNNNGDLTLDDNSDEHCTPNLQRLQPPAQFSKFPPAQSVSCGNDFTVVKVKASDARKLQDFSQLRMYQAPSGDSHGFTYSDGNLSQMDVITNASSAFTNGGNAKNGNGNGNGTNGNGNNSEDFDLLFAFGNNCSGQCGRSKQQSEQPSAGVVRLPQRRIHKVVCGDRHAACLVEKKRNGNGDNNGKNSDKNNENSDNTNNSDSGSLTDYDLFVWGSNEQGQIMPRNSLHTVCPPKNITKKVLKRANFMPNTNGNGSDNNADEDDSVLERSDSKGSNGNGNGNGNKSVRILDVWAGPECLAVYVEED